jgi:mannosyltransferase
MIESETQAMTMSPTSKPRPWQAPAFLLFVTWLAFALRVYHLSYQSLWRDEVDALRFATQPLTDLVTMFTRAAQNGPVYFLLLRPWLGLAGHTEFALRMPSVIFSTLAVPVTYALLARLAGRKPAALVALFMAVTPYQVWYGQEAKMYALVTLLVPLELWLVTRAVQATASRRPQSGWPYWLALYVLTSLSVYSHFVAGLAIPVQFLWIVLLPLRVEGFAVDGEAPRKRAGVLRRILWALVYLVALGLPYLPVVTWAVPLVLRFNYSTGFAFVSFGEMLTKLTQVFTRGPEAPGGLQMLPAILAVLAGSVLWGLARGRGGWRLITMLWVWLLLPPVLLYAISYSVPLFTERYLIWTMPAFMSLAALGCLVLTFSWRPLGLTVLGLILAFNMADTGMYQNTEIKSDFRAAVRYVEAQRRPDERLMFQIPYGQYTYEYYAGSLENFTEGPFTNAGASEAEVNQWMTDRTSGARAVWLISSEAWLWDQRKMTEAWLANHAIVTAHAEFPLITVTRYELNPGMQ